MKRLALTILTVAVLALPVCAQPPTAVADVPFGFVAGNATMPAGSYVVTVSTSSFTVALVGADLHTHFLTSIPTGVLSSSQLPQLIFHRYGSHYFLSEIRTPSTSREFTMSRSERESAKAAGGARTGQEIVLAMR